MSGNQLSQMAYNNLRRYCGSKIFVHSVVDVRVNIRVSVRLWLGLVLGFGSSWETALHDTV